MKNRPAAPLIVSAITLLATSLGVAHASAQDGRKPGHQDDSTVTAGKGERPTPKAAQSRQLKMESSTAPQSRQIKGENLGEAQLQSRQIKWDRVDDSRPQSRQIKIDGVAEPRPESRQIKIDDVGKVRPEPGQIKKGPPGDGG